MLIYDLGGGTFDVTVARITPDEIVILSTAGDHDLGGKNWDDRIATFLSERFAAETGFDPLDDPVALNEVLVRSEQAKWALSERTSTRITLQLGDRAAQLRAGPLRVRGDDVPAHGPDPPADRGSLGEAKLDLAPARRRALGRRLDPNADGPDLRLANGRQAPAGRRQRRRGGRAGRGHPGGHRGRPEDRRRRPATHALGRGPRLSTTAPRSSRRVTDVMSHSLGTIAVSPDGSAYVNDIVIRRNLPIPAQQYQVLPA